MSENYKFYDNTERGDLYHNEISGKLMTEEEIYNEWIIYIHSKDILF